MSVIPLLILYSFCIAAVALVARFLKRGIPAVVLTVIALLPVACLLPGFVSPLTAVPVDHIHYIAPWNQLPESAAPHHTDFANDLALQFAPWNKAVRGAWKKGEIPFRDRWNGCSTPLAANAQSAAFSPWLFLTLVLPLGLAPTMIAAGSLLVSGCGAWLWLRELELAPEAALAGAIGSSFAVGITSFLFFPQQPVACLWPGMLFLVELLGDRTVRFRASLLLAATVAAEALGGHPETLALIGLGTGILLVLRGRDAGPREAAVVIRRAALAACLGLGLTAFLIVPEALAVAASNRASQFREKYAAEPVAWTRLHPINASVLPRMFLPVLSGDSIAAKPVRGVATYPEVSLADIGIALVPLLLVSLVPGARRRCRLPFAVLFFSGAAIACGIWPVAQIRCRIPIVDAIVDFRFLIWSAIGGAALAAIEIDRLTRDSSSRRTAIQLLLATIGTIVGVVIIERFLAGRLEPAGTASIERRLMIPIGILVVEAAAIVAFGLVTRHPRVLALAITALVAVELAEQAKRPIGFFNPAEIYPATPLTRFLARNCRDFRATAVGSMLFPNSNVFVPYEDIRTHDPLERKDYVRFLDALVGYPPDDYFKQIQRFDSRALGFLSVRYLAAPASFTPASPRWQLAYSGTDGRVFENLDVLPKVRPAFRIRRIRAAAANLSDAWKSYGMSASEAVHAILDDNRTLLLESASLPFGSEVSPGSVSISGLTESTNRVSFRVSSREQDSRPVLITSYVNDGGWAARDESGRPIPTTLANGPFLAVAAPPGNHIVELIYWPPGFWPGFWVSVATLLISAEWGIARLAARRLSRGSSRRS